MFTGIVQGVAQVDAVQHFTGLHRLRLRLPLALQSDVRLGASIAVDGVCLTVCEVSEAGSVAFDVMQQTLQVTTLGSLVPGTHVNVERAARADSEVGGHPLSGHIDFKAQLAQVQHPPHNRVWRINVPSPWMRYIFEKGYVAVNGASLTVARCERMADGSGWIEVWLIPETLRQTTFDARAQGNELNIEVDRTTQAVVDTVERVLQQWAQDRGIPLSAANQFNPGAAQNP